MGDDLDMISEGAPVAPEPDAVADVAAEYAATPLPWYPGRDAFYSGSTLGGQLGALREKLGVEVPEGAESAGLRGWDFLAIEAALGAGEFVPSEDQWAEMWS